jgi:hypothetical protein
LEQAAERATRVDTSAQPSQRGALSELAPDELRARRERDSRRRPSRCDLCFDRATLIRDDTQLAVELLGAASSARRLVPRFVSTTVRSHSQSEDESNDSASDVDISTRAATQWSIEHELVNAAVVLFDTHARAAASRAHSSALDEECRRFEDESRTSRGRETQSVRAAVVMTCSRSRHRQRSSRVRRPQRRSDAETSRPPSHHARRAAGGGRGPTLTSWRRVGRPADPEALPPFTIRPQGRGGGLRVR